MKISTKVVMLLAFVSNFAIAQNNMLSCAMDGGNSKATIVFNSSTKSSELILSTSSVKGSVKVSDHHFYFIYPPTQTRRETHIIVNRYTGELEWEIGSKPFGKLSSNNILRKGSCKKSNVTKLF